jgi:acyl-CoA reductase-like NAD-dependent aldehyde dehydrogenase
MSRPVGPVAIFGASNFPLAFSVAGGDTASALAAGCPVVVKAHPAHPGTSALVGQLIREAVVACGAPEGVFSLLFDTDHTVGAALVEHPAIKAVGFTGSRRGGRALMDLAAARAEPIPVYAEMSSVNPVFVLAGALADEAETIAAGLRASVTLGTGQFCTNPGLVFVESSEANGRFMASLATLFSGSPAGTMLTADILRHYEQGVAALDRLPGVSRLATSTAPAGHGQSRPAVFVTDLANLRATPALTQEIFGPCTLVVLCPSTTAMRAAVDGLEGQLTATIHARPCELEAERELVEALAAKVGRLLHGGFPTGVEVCHAMVHGGPYPATSDGASSSVGTLALGRFLRPVAYQNFPDAALPPELQESNPLGLTRLVDGEWCHPAARG